MESKYTFWRLFKAQWSFKNDLTMVGVMFLCGWILSWFGLEHEDGKDISVLVTMYAAVILTVLAQGVYHSLKIIAMVLYCCSLIYCIRNNSGMEDLETYIGYYNKALTWRK